MALTFDKVNKIITVLSPDTEITIQNLLNSIREWEDDLLSMDLPFIASCAGKEPLGGGVAVGLTLTLLDDWQLAFEARTGPEYVQCKVSGGNIVATNANGSIYPTAFTQVLITASSSATQANISAIEFSSFNGGVSVDTSSSYSGTKYPIGTPQQPVNNMFDALSIAETRGFTTFYILGDITLDDSLNFVQYTFIGESIVKTEIDVDTDADVEKCEFYECTLTGVLDGKCKVKNCLAKDINYISGYIELCLLEGTLSIGGGATAYFMDCWAGELGITNVPVIDMGGAGQKLVMQNFNGMIKVQNMTGPSDMVGVTLNAGCVMLDSSITDGHIKVIGTGHVEDETTGNVVVDVSKLITTELFDDIKSDILDIPAIIENSVVEGSLTNIEMKRIMFAALAGLCSGGDTSTIKFRDLLNTKNRIDVVVDDSGNRLSIVLDGS